VVYCNAIDTSINAFEVRGDPLVFPKELKDLSKYNECSLVVIPWRDQSEYIEKLIWDSVTILDVPTAVVAQKATKNVDNSVASTSNVDTVKARSGSLYGSLPAFDVKSTDKISLRTKSVVQIVAVISGHAMDIVVLNIVSRFIADKNNHVVVFVASDAEAHSDEVKSAITSFTKDNEHHDSVNVVKCSVAASNIAGLYNECKGAISTASMFFCSFIRPSVMRSGVYGRKSSGSFSTTLANAIVPTPASYSSYSRVRFAGCDEVHHLELGQLGSLVYDDESITTVAFQIIVIHEGGKSNGAKIRRSSLDTEPIESGAGASLHPMELEMINRV